MLLATTRQDKLVLALLDCARVGTAHLPRPAAPTEWLRTHWKMALTASAGLATGVIAGWLAPWVVSSTAMLSGLGVVPSGWSPAKLESVVKALFVPAGMLLFYIVRVTYVYVAKAVRDFIGY